MARTVSPPLDAVVRIPSSLADWTELREHGMYGSTDTTQTGARRCYTAPTTDPKSAKATALSRHTQTHGMKIGIDASNLRSGGSFTHLSELLEAACPEKHGVTRVVVWGSRE